MGAIYGLNRRHLIGGAAAIPAIIVGAWKHGSSNLVIPNQSAYTSILDDTTVYTAGNGSSVQNNPWGNAGLTNGVDYTVSTEFIPGSLPADVFFSWNWPINAGNSVLGYPLIKVPTTIQQLSAYTTLGGSAIPSVNCDYSDKAQANENA
jgi:hypothetical protein